MSSIGGRCVAMTAGAAGAGALLLAAGVPGVVLLALAPVLVCLAMHVVVVHGDARGEALLRTARRAVATQALPASPAREAAQELHPR